MQTQGKSNKEWPARDKNGHLFEEEEENGSNQQFEKLVKLIMKKKKLLRKSYKGKG